MSYQIIQDTFVLFVLGVSGWQIFKTIRFPTPSFLGPIFLIGALRIARYEIPPSPEYLSPLVQMILGIYVGSKINRDTVRQLKSMIIPAGMIITWAIAVVFLLGNVLSDTTGLDIYTAMLSSSMGGLPEMTILAVSTNAKIEIIIIVQLCRVLLTLIAFPIILTYLVHGSAEKADGSEGNSKDGPVKTSFFNKIKCRNQNISFQFLRQIDSKETVLSLWGVLLTLAVAACGGFFLSSLGLPAGVMVGAMLFTAVVSLLGASIKSPSDSIFSFLLIGVGIAIANNITPDTVATLTSGNLLQVILISTFAIFFSSLAVAFCISKVTGWDYATSFLAAAPAGFTVMTMLAVKYDKDPFRVSMLHLCRLVALKIILPLFFMFADKV